MDDNRHRRKLQKSLRQQAAKIGEGKSAAEIRAIVYDTKLAIKAYKRQRRRDLWTQFWQDFNDPKFPRLLLF